MLAAEVRTPHTDFLQLARAGAAAYGGFQGPTQPEEIRSMPCSEVIEKSKTRLREGLACLPSATALALVLFSFSKVPCVPVLGFKITGGK